MIGSYDANSIVAMTNVRSPAESLNKQKYGILILSLGSSKRYLLISNLIFRKMIMLTQTMFMFAICTLAISMCSYLGFITYFQT